MEEEERRKRRVRRTRRVRRVGRLSHEHVRSVRERRCCLSSLVHVQLPAFMDLDSRMFRPAPKGLCLQCSCERGHVIDQEGEC